MSVICKPDDVVMVFPAACAIALLAVPIAEMHADAVTSESIATALVRVKSRILLPVITDTAALVVDAGDKRFLDDGVSAAGICSLVRSNELVKIWP
jgi:hypothetical protein